MENAQDKAVKSFCRVIKDFNWNYAITLSRVRVQLVVVSATLWIYLRFQGVSYAIRLFLSPFRNQQSRSFETQFREQIRYPHLIRGPLNLEKMW